MSKRSLLLISTLALSTMASATAVSAQCMVANTTVYTTSPSESILIVIKTLATPTFCRATSGGNSANCIPFSGGATTSVLFASAPTGAVEPFCQWDCDCGTVRTDESDGLPVELMGFSVDEQQLGSAAEVLGPLNEVPRRSSRAASGRDSNAVRETNLTALDPREGGVR